MQVFMCSYKTVTKGKAFIFEPLDNLDVFSCIRRLGPCPGVGLEVKILEHFSEFISMPSLIRKL